MQKIHKRLAPNHITELSKCEIFVFGSNLEGQHMGGAARYAYDHFGAEWGNGAGPQGRCYAIPTMHGPLSAIKPYVDDFIEYARQHPMNRFLLTRVGCGIAGFKDKDMAPLFLEAFKLPNVSFPDEWIIQLINYDPLRDKKDEDAPPVINMEVLQRLCEEHSYTIGAGFHWTEPNVLMRYVIDENKFGYKSMGNFFYFADSLYVWDYDDAWAADHNADVVEPPSSPWPKAAARRTRLLRPSPPPSTSTTTSCTTRRMPSSPSRKWSANGLLGTPSTII